MTTTTRTVCGFRWPLLDPNPEDEQTGAHHICGLPKGHDEPHRCWHDGDEHPQ